MFKKGDIIITCGLVAEIVAVSSTFELLRIKYLNYEWDYDYASASSVIYADNKLIRTLYGLETE